MSILNGFLLCLAPIVTDGDTLRCANTPARVRLFGVRSVDGSELDKWAAAALELSSAGGLVCQFKGASYNRIVAVCFNGYGVDVGKALIEGKMATEWCQYSKNYYGTCP